MILLRDKFRIQLIAMDEMSQTDNADRMHKYA